MSLTEVKTEKVVGRVTNVHIGYDSTNGVNISKGILEELPSHPEAEKCKIIHIIDSGCVTEKAGKKIVHKEKGKEASYIRKQEGKYGEEYVIDEG